MESTCEEIDVEKISFCPSHSVLSCQHEYETHVSNAGAIEHLRGFGKKVKVHQKPFRAGVAKVPHLSPKEGQRREMM